MGQLVLSREVGDEVTIKHGDEVLLLRVTRLQGGRVKLGLEAPQSFVIVRSELLQEQKAEAPNA